MTNEVEYEHEDMDNELFDLFINYYRNDLIKDCNSFYLASGSGSYVDGGK